MKQEGVRSPSMVEYVRLIDSRAGNGGHYDKIVRYASHLSSPIQLRELIPCNKKGEPLVINEKLLCYSGGDPEIQGDARHHEEEIKEALSRVIYVGFELIIDNSEHGRIEDRYGDAFFHYNPKDNTFYYDNIKTHEDLQKLGVYLTTDKAKELKVI